MDTYGDWTHLLSDSFRQFVGALGAYLPSLLGAAALLLGGWLIARILRGLILRVGTGMDRLVHAAGVRAGHAQWRIRWPVSRVVAGVVFWVIILFFVTAAAASLGLPTLADWLGRVIAYLPAIVAAGAIVFVGYLLGSLARSAVTGAGTSAGLEQAALLGRLVYLLILALTIIFAIGQIGLDVSLLVNIATIAVAAVCGGLALAFGLGAGGSVGNIIAAHYVRKAYAVGQRVRIEELEGTILELASTAVVLDTVDGRAMVPARAFSEKASLLLDEHGKQPA